MRDVSETLVQVNHDTPDPVGNKSGKQIFQHVAYLFKISFDRSYGHRAKPEHRRKSYPINENEGGN